MGNFATVVVDSNGTTFVVVGGEVVVEVFGGAVVVEVVGDVDTSKLFTGSLSVREFSSALQEMANNKRAERTCIFRISKLAMNFSL